MRYCEETDSGLWSQTATQKRSNSNAGPLPRAKPGVTSASPIIAQCQHAPNARPTRP